MEADAIPPKFEPARSLDVKLAVGDRWAAAQDYQGDQAVIGRVRARFGAAVATFDANGDGKLDIYLAAAVVGPRGMRDALLLNQGDGRFVEAAAAFGLPLDQASLGVAAADFDADRQIDLFLTGVGKNRLLRNKHRKGFEDQTQSLNTIGPPAISLMARWLDPDQDGDLDLYVVNYCAAEHADKAFLADRRLLPVLPTRSIVTTASPSRFRAAPRRLGSPGRGLGKRQVEERPLAGPRPLDRHGSAPGRRGSALRRRRA